MAPEGGSIASCPRAFGNNPAAVALSLIKGGTHGHRFTLLNDVSTRPMLRNHVFVEKITLQVTEPGNLLFYRETRISVIPGLPQAEPGIHFDLRRCKRGTRLPASIKPTPAQA